MATGNCLIGTSGWSYADWGRGRFYARGVKQRDWLALYSQRFPTVEINASFYRVPRPEVVARWAEMTGVGFVFAAKLWRQITHFSKLRDTSEQLDYFFAALGELGAKRGPLLIQLPPSLEVEHQRLEVFLDEVTARCRPGPWRMAVEFRHASWLCPPVYRLLDHRGAAVCLSDMPGCLVGQPNDAGFAYVRRHGSLGGYRGGYSAAEIDADAAHVCRWRDAGMDVYVYYNNDIEGHAVDNATSLLAAVRS
ncbi:MAG: DUF72 domain-containing protein [Candidatus Latescibacterota bacterium]